nr:MAG TPA: hypothetical protein [Caudoviricetes sp.]
MEMHLFLMFVMLVRYLLYQFVMTMKLKMIAMKKMFMLI